MITLRIPASRLTDAMQPATSSALTVAMAARAPECPVERIECDRLPTCLHCRSEAGCCGETA